MVWELPFQTGAVYQRQQAAAASAQQQVLIAIRHLRERLSAHCHCANHLLFSPTSPSSIIEFEPSHVHHHHHPLSSLILNSSFKQTLRSTIAALFKTPTRYSNSLGTFIEQVVGSP